VTSVSRGDVALEILGPSGPPHLAIVDWMMPGMTGIDLCRALRARKSDTYTYVILITARDDPDSMLAGLDAGADDFLAKPIAPEELRARLRAGQRIVELQERLIAAREEQRRHADRDGLTGVASRRHIFETLETGLSEGAAAGTPLTLAMIDLDDFKRVNDEHGHIVGDRVLRTACDLMQRQLRRTDAFGRYGGDEFVAVLPETTLREGAEIAQRMCDALSSREIECGELTLRVSATVGVATSDGAPCERETLLKWADRALFRGKAAGGNQVMAVDPETPEANA
jgi:diguanylate cyclase (GGDEF)-like protein